MQHPAAEDEGDVPIEVTVEDIRRYAIECSTFLGDLTDLVGQLLIVERARAAAEGVEVTHQLSCECGWPIGTDRDKCEDCDLAEALSQRAAGG